MIRERPTRCRGTLPRRPLAFVLCWGPLSSLATLQEGDVFIYQGVEPEMEVEEVEPGLSNFYNSPLYWATRCPLP